MKTPFRSACPITSALDIIGDKWTLVIIKQMLFEQKSAFKDFTESREPMATNVLASRLKRLEKFDLIGKAHRPGDRKTSIYTLTEKGLSLTPVLIELTLWSRDHLEEFHPHLAIHSALETVKNDREKSFKQIVKAYNIFKESLFNPT